MASKKIFVSNNFTVDASGLHAYNSERFVQSAKRQAVTSGKLQATSSKLQAPSYKRQAASGKLPNIFSLVKFPETSVERLYQDKCILRMLHMKRNLVW